MRRGQHRHRRWYSHWIITRGGKPCVVLVNPHYAKHGVLVWAEGEEEPTKFLLNRTDLVPSTYAKRRAETAITLTERYLLLHPKSGLIEHPFMLRVWKSSGEWKIVPVRGRGLREIIPVRPPSIPGAWCA